MLQASLRASENALGICPFTTAQPQDLHLPALSQVFCSRKKALLIETLMLNECWVMFTLLYVGNVVPVFLLST